MHFRNNYFWGHTVLALLRTMKPNMLEKAQKSFENFKIQKNKKFATCIGCGSQRVVFFHTRSTLLVA